LPCSTGSYWSTNYLAGLSWPLNQAVCIQTCIQTNNLWEGMPTIRPSSLNSTSKQLSRFIIIISGSHHDLRILAFSSYTKQLLLLICTHLRHSLCARDRQQYGGPHLYFYELCCTPDFCVRVSKASAAALLKKVSAELNWLPRCFKPSKVLHHEPLIKDHQHSNFQCTLQVCGKL
jgi:hypothetical protein